MRLVGAMQPVFRHINLFARSDLSYDLLAEANRGPHPRRLRS